jgi:HSP20 family molecular chaperone IbpA
VPSEFWAPFLAYTALEQEMHSVLDRIGARPWLEGFGWRPDTDIYRAGDLLVIESEVPGIEPGSRLRVALADGVLQVSGDRPLSCEVSDQHRILTERRYGALRRDVLLPPGVDPGAIRAGCRRGLLTVEIPIPKGGPTRSGGTATEIPVESEPPAN